jgi:methionyl-tRNA synthetase
MSFDHYGRTSSPIHHETSRQIFDKLDADGVFTLKSEQQLYDPEAKMFLADRFIRGTCPVCDYEDAYGDQCERCGSSLSPSELINPRSAITDATPVRKQTTHWYFPLADWQGRLEEWIDSRQGWKSNVVGQVRSWFADGLRDRAMTRDLPWGVDVPESAAERHGIDRTGKVLYVWFDAPIGYISATREWAAGKGDPDLWKTYWQSDDTKLVHFIGKDNIVFHCLIFPAMLMAHGSYVLPENVPANEFLNIQGSKLSTSRNWAVWLHEYLDAFPADYLRYALTTMLPETRDSDFSWSDFQARINSELADVLGNFVNRTLSFTHRFFDGMVPPLVGASQTDMDMLEAMARFPGRIAGAFESFRMREAVAETINLARLGNKYFNDTEPWHTRNSNPQACANTLHVSLQLCASLSVLLEPVMPQIAARLRGMLRLEGVGDSLPGGRVGATTSWEDAGSSLMAEGKEIGEAGILVTKIEDDVIQEQTEKLGNDAENTPAADFAPLKEQIAYPDFVKLDFRVARVLEAERVPKTDKLLRLQIDLGFERRQILAGVAEHVIPEALIGKSIVVVANLEPRKIRGLESNGMLLAAEDPDGKLSLVMADAMPGSMVS